MVIDGGAGARNDRRGDRSRRVEVFRVVGSLFHIQQRRSRAASVVAYSVHVVSCSVRFFLSLGFLARGDRLLAVDKTGSTDDIFREVQGLDCMFRFKTGNCWMEQLHRK